MKRIACLVLLAIGLARSAEADLIQITGGSMTGGVGPFGSMQISLSGDGFAYTGIGPFTGNRYDPAACDGSIPCSTVSSTGVFSGSDLSGSAIFQGLAPTPVGGGGQASLFLEISGPAVVLPIDLSIQTYTALIPFGVTGLFSGPEAMLPPITASLAGTGDASLTFSRVTVPGLPPEWRFVSSSYTFADPVPEPSSLWLLGSGVAAFVSRQRLKRRSRTAS